MNSTGNSKKAPAMLYFSIIFLVASVLMICMFCVAVYASEPIPNGLVDTGQVTFYDSDGNRLPGEPLPIVR
jgi:hypothetical protein